MELDQTKERELFTEGYRRGYSDAYAKAYHDALNKFNEQRREQLEQNQKPKSLFSEPKEAIEVKEVKEEKDIVTEMKLDVVEEKELTQVVEVEPTSIPTINKASNDVRVLNTKRSLLAHIILGIFTLGIYPIVLMCSVKKDINYVATPHDRKHTNSFFVCTILLSFISIIPLIWYTKLSMRVGTELKYRGIEYKFSAKTFWGWGFFGSMLFGVGPFIYQHKLYKAMNLISADFNVKGE